MCMEKVSCDLLQQEYGTLKTLAEEYKGVLLRESVGSEECQKAQKQFNKQVEQFRQRLAEHFSFLQKLFLKDEEAPEIQKIFDQHDTRKAALATIFRCREDQISTTKEKALSGDTVLHDDDLFLYNLTKLPEEARLPKYIKGGLGLGNLTELPEKVQLPEYVGGDLGLNKLTKLPEKVQLPEYVGGRLYLNSLTTLPEEVQLPEYVGGRLFLSSLTTLPEEVQLPKYVGGVLDLCNLTTPPKKVQLPEYIGDSLALNNLTELPDDFTFPEHIGGILFPQRRTQRTLCPEYYS